MSLKQEISFKHTGMDMDSDVQAIKPGDSPFRLNALCDIAEEAKLDDIFGVRGNTRTPYTQPAGSNECIAKAIDFENNAIIFLVYNSNGSHQIRRWYVDTNSIELILQEPLLNFKLGVEVHAHVIGGMLYWSYRYDNSFLFDVSGNRDFNPPRKINIQKALDYTNGDPDGYGAITFETLDRIKYQPQKVAELRFLNDATNPDNFLYGKLYQATYRYVNDDNEESTWSMLSKVLLPTYGYKDNNLFKSIENNIGVTINTGSELVKKIDIGFRINNTYYIVSRIDKAELSIPDDVDYEYVYDGLAYKEPIDPKEFIRSFDYVPQIVGAQEVMVNRVFDGDITEGYNDIKTISTASFERYDKTTDVRATSPDRINPLGPNVDAFATDIDNMEWPFATFKHMGLYQYGFVYYDHAGRHGGVQTKDEYIVKVPSFDIDAFANGIMFDPLKLRIEVSHTPPPWAKYWSIVLTKELTYVKKTQVLVTENMFTYQTGKLQLPTDLNYSFNQGDKVRLVAVTKAPINFLIATNGVTVNSSITYDDIASIDELDAVQNRLPPETFSYSETITTQASNTFDYEVDDWDPSTWEISFSKEDTVDIKTYFENHGKGPFNIIPENYYYILEIYNRSKASSENKIFFEIGEKYEVGDPHTAGCYHKAPVQDQTPGITPAVAEVYGFDTYLRRKKSKIEVWPAILKGANGAGTVTAGIYLTHPESYLPYFKDSNMSNVTTIDWDGTPPGALGDYAINNDLVFTNATLGATLLVWHTYIEQTGGTYTPDPARPLVYGIIFETTIEMFPWMEDDSFADDFVSAVYSDGRVNTNIDTLERKRYKARRRFSGKYFDNTFINNLSRVDYESYQDLDEVYNEITMIRAVGYMQKVRQRNKNNTVPVERTEYMDGAGNVQVVKSDEVLGAPIPAVENYGSILPSADVKNDKHSYWFDILNGKMIRDSYNGMVAISGNKESPDDPYKISEYTRLLSQKIIEGGLENFNIHGTWCDRTESYITSIVDKRSFLEDGNIVRNGDFSSDSGWMTGLTTSIVAGQGQFNSSDGDGLQNNMFVDCIEGVQYTLTFNVGAIGEDQAGLFHVALDGEVIEIIDFEEYTNGELITITFIAPTTSNLLQFISIKDCTGYIDNVSILVEERNSISQTLMFHEPTNRWKTFLSHIPERYAQIGQSLISFKNGELWVHYTNPLYNNFYGIQYETIVDVVCNAGKDIMKVFDNMDVYSNEMWDVPEITIDKTLTEPNGMSSRIPKSRFRKKEGKSHTHFMRDQSDPAFTIPRLALHSGRKLRGDAIRVRLVNDDDFLVTLKAVVIHFTPSNLTT